MQTTYTLDRPTSSSDRRISGALDFGAILSKFPDAKKSGSGFVAKCPAHGDSNPSLSITQGTDGRTLLFCHAGCTLDAICQAAQIKMSDLFPKPERLAPKIIATYDYTDTAGKLLSQVCRYDPKDFRQRRPDGKGGWIWKGGIEQVPFHLPDLIKAVSDGRTVFVCEGEKDCLAMEKSGFAATCNAGGAGKWRDNFAQYFDAANVVIIADKDEPGRKHARKVAESLRAVASSVRVMELPDVGGHEVKDAADYLSAGGAPADLDELAQNAPLWNPESEAPDDLTPTIATVTNPISNLPALIDAAEFIHADLPEPKQLIENILHQGCKLALGGGSKSFKTWTLLDMALSVAYGLPWLNFQTQAAPVCFINFELQPWTIQGRIKALAQAKGISVIPGRLHLLNLRGKAANYNLLLPQIRERVKEQFGLIILDPIYKIYGQAKENDSGDVALVLNAIESLAVDTGSAVAFGSHFSKGNQSGKESIDRISGSGVFARDPDSLLMLTKHETENCFTVDATLRAFKPVDPFVVRWEFPLMKPDSDLNPADLKQVAGRKAKHDPKDLLRAIANNDEQNPVSISHWADLTGMARTSLNEYLTGMRAKGWIKTIGEGSKAKQAITNKGKAYLNE